MTGSAGGEKNDRSYGDLTKVRFTNLDKVMYPLLSVTKQEVITYYIRMAPGYFLFLTTGRLPCTVFPTVLGVKGFMRKMPPGKPRIL